MPVALFTLTKYEKRIFCKRLFDLKLPDGYKSNIGNCVSVDECKISSLKLYDCHILVQQLLPAALKGLLTKEPMKAIFQMCYFLNKLCQKIIDREDMLNLEEKINETLCMFERFYLLAFFDIMIHLPIHLEREARLGGPVQYRWMYRFER